MRQGLSPGPAAAPSRHTPEREWWTGWCAKSGRRSASAGSEPSTGRSSEARPALADAYTIGKSSTSAESSGESSRSKKSSYVSSTTSAMRASERSTLLMTRTTGVSRPASCGARIAFAAADLPRRRPAGRRHRPSISPARPRHRNPHDRACHDVDRDLVARRAGVVDRRVLGEDRDAFLALEVHRVHDPFADITGLSLMLGEYSGLPEHRIDQGGFPVVNMSDDGDVAQVAALPYRHAATLDSVLARKDQFYGCGHRPPNASRARSARSEPADARISQPRPRDQRDGVATNCAGTSPTARGS